MKKFVAFAAALACILLIRDAFAGEKGLFAQPGQVVVRETTHGRFALYAPLIKPRRILLLAHGTIPDGDDGVAAARGLVELFSQEADRRGLLLVAPAFSDADFGGHAGPGGGYRGLFGRVVRADEFVNEIIDEVLSKGIDDRIVIIGHSAGGQFVSRYIVMHPQRVRAAVICAAGTFAFPDTQHDWADGMAPLRRSWRWGNDPPKEISVTPDPDGWKAAAQLPIQVLAGEKDTTEVPKMEGQQGENLQRRSRLWVKAMNDYARQRGVQGQVRYRLVPNAGHGMNDLMKACLESLP